MNNIDINDFLKIKSELDNALLSSAESVAKRSGISSSETEIIIKLFFDKNQLSVSSLEETGFIKETDNLLKSGYIQISENNTVILTGKGKIAGKSLLQAQEKCLNSIFADITVEEYNLLKNVFGRLNINNN